MLNLTLRLDSVRDAYYTGRREVPAIERDIGALMKKAGEVITDQGILEETFSSVRRVLLSHGARVQLNEARRRYDNEATPLPEKTAYLIGWVLSHQ